MGLDPQTVKARLRATIESHLATLGVELVDLELAGGSKRPILRLFLDQEGGIGIEDCARLSRSVGALLDVEDPFAMRYILEVSSPGLNRPLSKPAHFARYVGSRIKLKTHRPVRGTAKNFTGKLVAFHEEPARIDLEDEVGVITIRLDDIAKAHIEYSFEDET